MSSELKILKLFCSDRVVCDQNFGYIKQIKNLDKELKVLFNLVASYYEKYSDAKSIGINELKTYYDLLYPISKDKQVYTLLIEEIYSVNINESLIKDLIEQTLERHFSSIIVNKLLPVVEGNMYNVLPKIQDQIDEYLNLMSNPPDDVQELMPNDLSLDDLFQELHNDGLGWHISSLDDIVGKVKLKTLGLIYAFVDSGKTSFSLAACAKFASQLNDDQCIVYAGNEEPSNRLNLRLTQAMLNITRSDMLNNPQKCGEDRIQRGFNKIKLFDSITSIKHVQRLLEMYSPTVVFVDQATNIEFTHNDKEDVATIKRLFRSYRELAKKYNCAIIGVTQGVGEAENKKWLDLSDIYGSRVAIQGALDYAIGIGRLTQDLSKETQRFLHISKNKLLDGASGKITINFIKEKCLWEQV